MEEDKHSERDNKTKQRKREIITEKLSEFKFKDKWKTKKNLKTQINISSFILVTEPMKTDR